MTRLQTSNHSFQELFRQPSLWKGPIVPFVFGLWYYLFPFPEAVLVLNAVAFACAASCLYLAFRRLGAGGWEAAVPVLLWGAYPPHRLIFGYYFAEPLLSLQSALLFLVAAHLAVKPARGLALAGGVLAGILILARAPFLPVVAGLGVWILFRAGKHYRACSFLFCLGMLAAFLPWPIRNLMVEGAFVPFTTEGGKILFQGTYLPGDDQVMSELRRIPEFQRLEHEEAEKAPIEQMHYWKALALKQIREHPAEQLQLCLRKAMRFWVYLSSDSWIPTWKTGIVAAICLALAAVAGWRGWREPLVQLCLLWVGGLWLFHGVVHAELRYNLPVLPMLFLLGLRTTFRGSLFSRMRYGLVWRWRLWRRRQFLQHFQNGPVLIKAIQSKQPCSLVVCQDGTRLTHPAARAGFVNTLVEVWHERAYTPPGFYHPADADVVIDAGANVGLFTIWLAKQNPLCRVIALEPFAENFEHLRDNLAAAHAYSATAYQLALGGTSGRGSMISVGHRSLDHRLSMLPGNTDGEQEIAVITLGELLDLAGVDRIAFLKLDIEGAEFEVFENLGREHLIRIDRLAIEFHEHLRAGTRDLLVKRLIPTHHVIIQPDHTGLYGMIFAAIRTEVADATPHPQ